MCMSTDGVTPSNSPSLGIPRPPQGGSSVTKQCEHKYIYLGQRRELDKNLNSSSMTKQVDVFYCEKCLEIRKVTI